MYLLSMKALTLPKSETSLHKSKLRQLVLLLVTLRSVLLTRRHHLPLLFLKIVRFRPHLLDVNVSSTP